MIPIYYSPTPTNQRLVEKLSTVMKTRFVPLDEDIVRRAQQLTGIAGQAVYLWGDGEKHHESYFFTRDRARFKVNIDWHSDRADARFVDYWNHIQATQNDGISVATQIHEITGLLAAIEMAKTYRAMEVALTVDLDGLRGFPVCRRWVNSTGLSVENAKDAVRRLNGRLHRLDIGGLIENMPPFELVEGGTQPITSEILAFLTMSKEWEEGRELSPAEQMFVNRIGTFVTYGYFQLINAFCYAGL